MAARIGSLFVSLVADMSGFESDMKRGGALVRTTTAGMRRDLGITEKSVRSLGSSTKGGFDTRAILTASRSFETMNSRVGLLRGTLLATTAVFGGLAASLGANVLSRWADQFTSLQNSIRPVAKDAADLAAQTQAVADVANRSRSSLSATAVLYSRLFKAAPTQGAEKLLRYTETINKALQSGGATAQEASSAAIQFSQAIQSNRLGGEELRAVLETPLGGQLAKGLGVTIGEMRKMAVAGELTADVVLGALDKISEGVDRTFAGSVATLDQSLTVLDNNLTKYVGETDKAYGVTRAMSGGIMGLANNLESIIPTLSTVIGLLGAGFVGKRIGNAGNSLIGRAQTNIQARQDAVAEARAEARQAQLARDAARGNVISAMQNVTAPDQRQFADKGALKAYQRDLAAVEKLDAGRLAGLQAQADAINKIGAIGKTVTPNQLKMARTIAAAETSVNAELSNQATLRKSIAGQQNMLTAMLARQSTFTGSVTGLKELQDKIVQTEGIIRGSQQQLERSERTYAATSVKLATDRAKAGRQVSTELVAAAVGEHQTRMALLDNEAQREAAVARLRQSSAAAAAGGVANTTGALQSQVSAARGATLATSATKASLDAALKNAKLTSVAWTGLKAVGGSLLAFIGGPWGAAFAAASLALGYFALEAQKSSARADGLKSEMEALGIMSEDTAGKIDLAAKSLRNLRADQLRSKLGDLDARKAEIYGGSSMNSMGFGARTLGDVRQNAEFDLSLPKGIQPANIRKAKQEIVDLIRKMEAGKATSEDIDTVLKNITVKELNGELDDSAAVLGAMKNEAMGIAEYTKQTVDSLKEINTLQTDQRSSRVGRTTLDSRMAGWGNDGDSPELQKEIEKRTSGVNTVVDEELRRAQLTDRQREIEDSAKDLAAAIKKATGIVVSAASMTETATKLIDTKENQEAIKGGILELIRKAEGTGEGSRGYNETLGNGRWTGGDVNLVAMTLKEVLALQAKMLTPENQKVYGQGGSSAVGAYQIVGKTLKGLIGQLGLSGDELFDKDMQDRLAMQLLRQTGGKPDALRGTWEGLKVKGYTDEQLSTAYNGDSNDIGNMDKEVAERNKEAIEGITEAEEDRRQGIYDTMQVLREELTAVDLEAKSVGMSEAAKKKAALIQETINRLMAEGLTLSQATAMANNSETQSIINQIAAKEQLKATNEEMVDRMDTVRDTARDALGTFVSDLREGKSGAEALTNALGRIEDKLLDLAMNTAIDALFGKTGTSGGGIFGNLIGSLFGGGGTVAPAVNHTGGVVGAHGRGTGRRVSASVFAGAPRFHGGLNSREFPTILEQGERVLTAQQSQRSNRVMSGLAKSARNGNGGGGSMVKVNVINNGPGEARTEEKQDSNGGRSIDVIIDEKVAGLAGGRSRTSRVLEDRYGMSEKVKVR